MAPALHRMPARRAAPLAAAALAALTAVLALPAAANTQASGAIYTCVDDKGRKLTSDRLIAECTHREQRVLNRDGSLRQIVPPTLTAEERAAKEARDRREAEARAAQREAERRDRNLVQRFPDEAAHQRAREAALGSVRNAIAATETRTKELQAERKPLLDETEFYKGKPLPLKLKQALDANDAATQAQREAAATQAAELARINRLYDTELARLKRLWAGAAPGSLDGAGAAGVTAVKATR